MTKINETSFDYMGVYECETENLSLQKTIEVLKQFPTIEAKTFWLDALINMKEVKKTSRSQILYLLGAN
jgi:hypothetical protein